MSGYVYFIQAKRCRLIKIGYSDDPQARLKTLQLAGPDQLTLLAIMPGDLNQERELHSRFSDARQHGEWFGPKKALLTFIDEVRATHPQVIKPTRRTTPTAEPTGWRTRRSDPDPELPSLSERMRIEQDIASGRIKMPLEDFAR